MAAIDAAVSEFWTRGVKVLSPADPRVVDFRGEFLFVASDRLRSIKLVQDRHFEAIGHSDFLWLVCPDGYTGPSTCLEIGYARRAGIAVYSEHLPLDITVQHYIEKVSSIAVAIQLAVAARSARSAPPHVLLDPTTTIEKNIEVLEQLKPILLGLTGQSPNKVERTFKKTRNVLAGSFGLDAPK
jgi:hypothetical protein